MRNEVVAPSSAFGPSIAQYVAETHEILQRLDLSAIDLLCQRIEETRDAGGTIFFFGNGGSASTASHFVVDLVKGASYGHQKRIRAMALNDSIATVMAYANDVAYADVFVEPLRNFLNPGDLVVAISGSGNSENVVRAVRYANEAGGRTFGLCGFGGGRLAAVAQESLTVDSYDMQHVEDIHVFVCHMVLRVLTASADGS